MDQISLLKKLIKVKLANDMRKESEKQNANYCFVQEAWLSF